MKVHLETDRLIIRELEEYDAEGIFELDSDPEVHEFLGKKTIKTINEAHKVIDFIRKQYVSNGIGISLLFVLFFTNCYRNEDCIVISDFIYVNNTTHIIETSIGIIDPNSKMSKNDESLGACDVISSDFVPPFIGETEIIFDNIKCLVYKSGLSVGIGDGPVGVDNYISTRIDNNHYEFIYTFTEEEYNKAIDCE